jgi:hypothetical protein
MWAGRAEVRGSLWRGAVTLLCVALAHGCFLDREPPREPLERIWNEWMLAGHYGRWSGGQERSWQTERRNTTASHPLGARDTKYGIEVNGGWSGFAMGGWGLLGGLIGRAETPTGTVELFGKEIVRVHWPEATAKYGRDYSYEFFLVLRPRPAGRGRVIKQWHFPPAELALTITPQIEEWIRQSTSSEKDARRQIEQNKSHMINGYLKFDAAARSATVTITGLTTPFVEHIDLSRELDSGTRGSGSM